MTVCNCLGCTTTGSNAPPHLAPHIPMYLLAEIMEEWCQQNGFEFVPESGNDGSGQQQVAFETGVHIRRIFDIRQGSVEYKRRGRPKAPRTWVVSFDNADKIVTRLHMQHEWIDGRLAPFYGPIAVTRRERELGYEMPQGVPEAA